MTWQLDLFCDQDDCCETRRNDLPVKIRVIRCSNQKPDFSYLAPRDEWGVWAAAQLCSPSPAACPHFQSVIASNIPMNGGNFFGSVNNPSIQEPSVFKMKFCPAFNGSILRIFRRACTAICSHIFPNFRTARIKRSATMSFTLANLPLTKGGHCRMTKEKKRTNPFLRDAILIIFVVFSQLSQAFLDEHNECRRKFSLIGTHTRFPFFLN